MNNAIELHHGKSTSHQRFQLQDKPNIQQKDPVALHQMDDFNVRGLIRKQAYHIYLVDLAPEGDELTNPQINPIAKKGQCKHLRAIRLHKLRMLGLKEQCFIIGGMVD